MPRLPNPDVRRRLLSAGLELMRRDGFAGAGVKDICDGAGVPKGSFYSYFPSKELFAAAVLTAYWAPIEDDLFPGLRDVSVPAEQRIGAFFHHLADEHASHDFVLGCLIGRMALELGGDSDAARSELARIIDRWDAAISACILDGHRRGDLPAESAAKDVAAVIVEAWEGAALRAKVERSRQPYERFERTVLPRLLGTSIPA